MSTVEKAFLKSIADKKGDDDAHKDLADDLDLPPVPQKKHDPNQLSSSRRANEPSRP